MIVLKFGGSSVANITRINRVAQLINKKYLSLGEKVVVVVSAMYGMTDSLNEYLIEIGGEKNLEHDVVLSSGEPISTALMSIALNNIGYKSQSLLGWQIPIITSDTPRNARIIDIPTGNIHNCLDNNIIPVIAGFQGITENSRITTLGRGGSDATAVAIAAALNAERCDIYTDVDGIYTADPRIVPLAKKIDRISYEEVFEMAFSGAKVLQSRSVELAMKHHVNVRVLSSFDIGNGTDIVEDKMENLVVTGITNQSGIVKFDLNLSEKNQNHSVKIMSIISEKNFCIEWLSQANSGSEKILSFIVNSDYANEIINKCNSLKDHQLIKDYIINYDIAKISVVGIGIGSHNETINKIFTVLEKNNIEILSCVTSSLSIRILVTKPNIQLACTLIHTSLGLDLKM